MRPALQSSEITALFLLSADFSVLEVRCQGDLMSYDKTSLKSFQLHGLTLICWRPEAHLFDGYLLKHSVCLGN